MPGWCVYRRWLTGDRAEIWRKRDIFAGIWEILTWWMKFHKYNYKIWKFQKFENPKISKNANFKKSNESALQPIPNYAGSRRRGTLVIGSERWPCILLFDVILSAGVATWCDCMWFAKGILDRIPWICNEKGTKLYLGVQNVSRVAQSVPNGSYSHQTR